MALRGNKKKLAQAYRQEAGNITQACKRANLSRETFYNYLADPAFKAYTEQVWEEFVDFTEGKLKEKVNQGDTKAIIFALKTKGKKRGWTEKQEVKLEGSVKVEQITGMIIK